MNWADIQEMIKDKKIMEGYQYEFKAGFPKGKEYRDVVNRSIADAIVSFANSDGGRLIIGIKDQPIELAGLDIADWGDKEKVALYIQNILEKNDVSPTIADRYTTLQPIINPDGTKVAIVVEVEKGLKPYYIDGEIYLRGATGKRKLKDSRDINEFLIRRSEGNLIYQELLRADRCKVVFGGNNNGFQTNPLPFDRSNIALVEKEDWDDDSNSWKTLYFVTFNDAFENLSENIKRCYYLFIEWENLRDELLALCSFWKLYSDCWNTQYPFLNNKARALAFYHEIVIKSLSKSIEDFEAAFNIQKIKID